MKHDKVFIIPERMAEIIPNNPNTLPWQKSEAFIGVPLFHDGKCFAHFGMIWSSEGAKRRNLSWGYIEMFLHSLEDMIQARILEGKGFARDPEPESETSRIIPLSAITASQSMKPYARSLSHELRTPMQGVIGLLDVMHYTVIDAIDSQENNDIKEVFQNLKDSIEQIQDSSKRAVEAADNVVHAYDHNMEMPDTPLSGDGDLRTSRSNSIEIKNKRPNVVVEGSGIPLSPGNKRARDEPIDYHPGPPMKRMAADARDEIAQFKRENSGPTGTQSPDYFGQAVSVSKNAKPISPGSAALTSQIAGAVLSSAHRHLTTREFLHNLVNEALYTLHPVEQRTSTTATGETTNVKIRRARGETEELVVNLCIHPDVPSAIVTEEQHLAFSLQKVVDNAIKFTTGGTITIDVSVARGILEFRVIDTGCGMTDSSKEHIFKPHFQEDNTIARRKDGLGLSLFNAKAHVRKDLGGDMTLERSSTTGPSKGSEFLIRIPLSAAPDATRPDMPLVGTPIAGSRLSRATSPVPASNSSLALPPMSAPRRASPAPQTSPSAVKHSKKQGYNRELAKEVPLNFLVAEDNLINRNLLVTFLKRLGYASANITIAEDGVEAVRCYEDSLLKPAAERINAILMDLWMPNMDGYEATKKIFRLAADANEHVAVMAVTADITSSSIEKATQTGMRGFLSKPYKVVDIEKLIQEHFGSGYSST